MLTWLVEERNIAPHIPVIDKSARHDGTFAERTSAMTPMPTPTSAGQARF